jgi:hypothetical protein
MNHVLMDAASARVVRVGAHGKVIVSKLTPHAEYLDPFGLVAIDEKVVLHG